jgi:hypothetical protein
MRRAIRFSCVGAALIIGCAHPGISQTDGWSAAKTKHFTMYVPTGDRFGATLLALEYSYAAFSASPFFKDVDMGGPVEAMYVNGQDMTELFGFKRDGAALASVPGGSKLGATGLIVLQDDPDGDKGAEMLAHLFIQKRLPKAPLWFHEGFSAYLRSVKYQEGEGKRGGCFGFAGSAPETWIALDKLFNLTWEEYDAPTAKSWAKHSARTMVDYIIHIEGGKYFAEGFGALYDGFGAGKGSAEVVGQIFGGGALAELNSKVMDHGKSLATIGKARGLCPLGVGIPEDKAADKSDPKMEEIPADDMAKLIQGLMKLPGRGAEAYPPWYPPDMVAKAGG